MRTRLLHFVAFAVLLAGASRLAMSQETPARTSADSRQYYKLSFVLRETDQGKVLNQRTFTMNIAADAPQTDKPPAWWNLRSGTRVPITDSKGITTYIDVGVNLDVRAVDVAGGLQLEVTSEISSAGTETGGGGAPPIRQVKVRSAVMAVVGKATMVFMADDPASQHRFELEVTPVREK
jgi:hypothetical protein